MPAAFCDGPVAVRFTVIAVHKESGEDAFAKRAMCEACTRADILSRGPLSWETVNAFLAADLAEDNPDFELKDWAAMFELRDQDGHLVREVIFDFQLEGSFDFAKMFVEA
jgi:hypothetical protein